MASRRRLVIAGIIVAILLASGGIFITRRFFTTYPVLTLPTDSVWALAFDPAGTLLAGADYYGDVVVWQAHDGVVRHRFPTGRSIEGPALRVQLAFDTSGQMLAQSGPNGVRLWDVSSGQELTLDNAPQTEVGALAFPDTQQLYVWTRAGELIYWEVPSGRLVRRQTLPALGAQGARFSHDGQRLLTCRGESDTQLGQVETWQLRDGALQKSVTVPGTSFACTLATTADGTLATVHFGNNAYSIVDLQSGTVQRTLSSLEGFEAGAATFNARGTWIALGNSNSIALSQVASGHRLATLKMSLPLPFVPSVRILSLAVSADERLVAAGCNDGYIRLWRR